MTLFLAFLSTTALSAAAGTIQAKIVVKDGDAVGGSTVTELYSPFTDGNGKVGFVGALADSQRFIWWNTGPVFLSGSSSLTLSGGESTMGISNTGGFIYSPSVNGNDAVVTHGGALLQKGDAIPPLSGLYSSFNSRPQMLPDGTAYWIGGSTDVQGSSTSTNRQLFKATDPADPSSITRVLGGGDVIDGKTVLTSASNFDYGLSDNGAHHIHVLEMDTGDSSTSSHLYLDGAFVAQEGFANGSGDNWSSFDNPSINNAGNYIFSGFTSSAINDAFLASNGVIAVREGDMLGGILLESGIAVEAASINDLGEVAHIWGGAGVTNEHLFFGLSTNLTGSTLLLSTNDGIDIDGNGSADWIITDFNASRSIGPGLDLAEDGFLYVEVDLMPLAGGPEIEAIIGLDIGHYYSAPEPATMLLLGLGLMGLAGIRRKIKK